MDASVRDLYYRLNIFPVNVPSSRERMEDLPLLAKTLLSRVAHDRKLSISAEAMRRLHDYPYPGNVRELRNLLERAALLCDGEQIMPEHMLQPDALDASGPFIANVSGIGDDELQRQLVPFRGNRKALAESPGMSERTLYRRIRKLKGKGS